MSRYYGEDRNSWLIGVFESSRGVIFNIGGWGLEILDSDVV